MDGHSKRKRIEREKAANDAQRGTDIDEAALEEVGA